MNKIKSILSLCGIFYFLSCAAIQSPSGGPKDETPPEIIKVIPPDKSINFKDKNIKVIFSEYIEESSISKAVEIFPKPSNPIKINLKNPSLIIEFNDSLIKNQTYVVSINRNLTDEHKVKIDQGIQLAFSTGNKIDEGSISGRVYHTKIASVELWRVSNLDNKDLLFFERNPDYIVDASDNGDFQFNFLSNGFYKIISVDKTISGLPIVEHKMIYGLSNENLININTQDTLKHIKIKIPESIGSIKMNKAEYIIGGWGKLMFSEEVNNWEDNLSIDFYDDSLLLKPKIFRDPLNDFTLNFNLDINKKSYVDIQTYQSKDQNLIKVDSSRIRLEIKNEKDSSNIKIISPNLGFVQNIEEDSIQALKIIFSNLIHENIKKNSLLLKRDSINIPIKVEWDSYLSVNVTPQTNWEESTQYKLLINKNFIEPIYTKSLEDSILTISFKTSKFRKFGNFLGNFDEVLDSMMIVELSSLENISEKLQTNVKLDGSFKILKIPEGNYSLQIYVDMDKNHKYSYGSLNPYRPAEWFNIYPDTIKVRGNWDLEMKNIKVGY